MCSLTPLLPRRHLQPPIPLPHTQIRCKKDVHELDAANNPLCLGNNVLMVTERSVRGKSVPSSPSLPVPLFTTVRRMLGTLYIVLPFYLDSCSSCCSFSCNCSSSRMCGILISNLALIFTCLICLSVFVCLSVCLSVCLPA